MILLNGTSTIIMAFRSIKEYQGNTNTKRNNNNKAM